MQKNIPTNFLTSSTQKWDIFCRVIDNFGDIGVCWRLANLLVHQHQQSVRLWVDDLWALQRIYPTTQLTQQQVLQGIEVMWWREDAFSAFDGDVADVVIEAFGCKLPEVYEQIMGLKVRSSKSAQAACCVWINLEYLTAESWAVGCHGLGALQNNGVMRYFFFPGMVRGTGGLMREADYEFRKQTFLNSVVLQQAFCKQWGLPNWFDSSASVQPIKVSLFAYENAGLLNLLQAWQVDNQPVLAFLPEGKLLAALNDQLNCHLQVGQTWQQGNLTLVVMPFLPQADYDQLLWLCDLNFVRGEESFVRAQWAAKPFIWQIYPTEDHAHLDKLQAFLDIYPAPAVLQQVVWGWNQQQWPKGYWQNLREALPEILKSAQLWQNSLVELGELSHNLFTFAKKVSK